MAVAFADDERRRIREALISVGEELFTAQYDNGSMKFSRLTVLIAVVALTACGAHDGATPTTFTPALYRRDGDDETGRPPRTGGHPDSRG